VGAFGSLKTNDLLLALSEDAMVTALVCDLFVNPAADPRRPPPRALAWPEAAA